MFLSTGATKCDRYQAREGYGYIVIDLLSGNITILYRTLELSRKPQNEGVIFEMHFAARGRSDAHVALSLKPVIFNFLGDYGFDYYYNLYEIGKI